MERITHLANEHFAAILQELEETTILITLHKNPIPVGIHNVHIGTYIGRNNLIPKFEQQPIYQYTNIEYSAVNWRIGDNAPDILQYRIKRG